MFRLVLCVFVMLPAFGQIRDLAATDDGSVLFFASTLRPAGANDGPQSKIFRWDGQFRVLRSAAAKPEDAIYTQAFTPVVSGDGKVYGWAEREDCLSICISFGNALTYVSGSTAIGLRGHPAVSHNGRYVVGAYGALIAEFSRVNIATGDAEPVAAYGTAYGITDDGEVLLYNRNGLTVAAPRQIGRLISESADVRSAAISANGRRILYSAAKDGIVELRDEVGVIATAEDNGPVGRPSAGFQARLSNDGRRAVVLQFAVRNGAQTWAAWWVDLNTRQTFELGALRDRAATISGDGRITWLFREDGFLEKRNLDTGESETIAERIPTLAEKPMFAPVLGSLNRIEGSGIDAGKPWRVLLTNGERSATLPAVEAAETHLDYALPWSLPAELSAAWAGYAREGSALETVRVLRGAASVTPQFWMDAGGVKAVHGDFSGLVTPQSPARPGETIHVYMSGLGPVTPGQADYAAAAGDTPAVTANPVSCVFTNEAGSGYPARVWMAGLAAGMVGVYQVTLEVPVLWTDQRLLTCEVGGWSATGGVPVGE